MAKRKTPNIYERQLKDGSKRYDVMLTFYPESGKRQQKMVTFTTKKAAQDALARNRTDRLRGEAVVPSRVTVADLMDRWLEVHSTSLRSTSVDAYRVTIRRYIVPQLGAVAVQALTAERLERHYAALRKAGVGAVSIHGVHRRMVQALDYAVRHHLVPRNVAKDAASPSYEPRKRPVWNGEQLARFLAVAQDSLFGPFFWIDAITGLRRGEMMGLRWSDVDWDAAVLHVRQNLVYLRGKFEVHSTKTGQERAIAVPGSLLEVLRTHRARQNEWRLKRGAAWPDNDLVLTTHLGTEICPQNLYPEFRRLCELADVPHIRLHDVRHTHATDLLNRGWTITDVAARLGHRDTTTTLNTYLHALPDRYSAMVEQMARDLGLAHDA